MTNETTEREQPTITAASPRANGASPTRTDAQAALAAEMARDIGDAVEEANGRSGEAGTLIEAGQHIATLPPEDRAQAHETIRVAELADTPDDQLPEDAERSTWAPVELVDVLASENRKPPPVMLPRTDGERLVYAGKIHLFYGEPESAKGWLCLHIARERIEAGEHVLYIDFEDEAEEAVERLLTLGVEEAAIRERFHYVRPDEPFDDRARREVERLVEAHRPTWAVLDGLTDALAGDGVQMNDNTEVADWFRGLPGMLRRRGLAVGIIDHVTKARDARGGYSIGAQHKKGRSDVSYELIVKEPLGRGMIGRVQMLVSKDRGGYVRPLPNPGSRVVANVLAESDEDGRLSIELQPASPTDSGEAWRPTGYMERVSSAVEARPGLNLRELRDAVPGDNKYVDQARSLLIGEGCIEERTDGPAKRHYPLKPYREPGPERAPDPPDAPGAVSI